MNLLLRHIQRQRHRQVSSDALSTSIAREAADVIRLYDFSEDASVSLLSESENKVYLENDPAIVRQFR